MQLRPSDIGELLEIMNSKRFIILEELQTSEPELHALHSEVIHKLLLHFQNEVLDELRQSAFPQPYKRL